MTSGEKQTLRAEALARRVGVSPSRSEAFARRLARIGPHLAQAHRARVVSAFASIGDEIPTAPLLAALHDAGFSVALPVTGRRGTPLVFRRWTPSTHLVSGPMDIPEPPADADVLDPDLLFVPLVAFDRRGQRIGYGAGFYDVTLRSLRKRPGVVAVGVAYREQEVLFVPAGDHDEPLDFVVTETETIVFADDATAGAAR